MKKDINTRCRYNSFILFVIILSTIILAVIPVHAGLDEWTPVGPKAGYVPAVAVNQNDCDSIYAITDGNLYVTADQGHNWEHITAAPNGMSDIYIDPVRTATLYALASFALHKSTDAGASWTELVTSVYSCALDPQHSERMFAGSRNGTVRKSTDGGSTWADMATGSAFIVSAIAVSHADSNTVFTGTRSDWGDYPGDGVFKTTDGGLTWFPADSLLPQTDISLLVIDPVLPETIYTGTSGGMWYYAYGVYRSTNGGLSWEAANTGLPDYASIGELKAIPGESGSLYAAASSLYQSDDGGTNWTEIDLGLNANGVSAVDFCSLETDAIFIGSGYGLLKMASWYDKAALMGVAPVNVDAVAVDPSNTDIIYAGGYTIYKSENGGVSWEINNIGLGTLTQGCKGIVIDPANTDVIYTGNYHTHGNVYKSIDAAATWDTSLADVAIKDIAIDPHGSDTIYTGGLAEPYVGALFKSIDAGGSWNIIDGSIIQSIAIDPVRPGVLYAGTHNEGVKKSTDGGATWSFVNNGLPEPGIEVDFFDAIAIDPLDPDVLYCGTIGAGIYKSINGGAEWFEANSGLPYLDVRDIEIDPIRPSIVYAGVYGYGVSRSIDGGRNWKAMNTGLPDGQAVNIEIDPVSPNIIYGCCSAGLFRYESSFNPYADVEAITIGNYPNPFVYGTTIEYAVAQPCRVRMKVYNVAGKEVATLVDKIQSPGRYMVSLDARNLSTGVYFIKMEFGNRTITKKCVLVK